MQEKDREVELRGVRAALDKANEQVSDATWRESLSLENVRQLRREVEVLGAALADMRAQRVGGDPRKHPRSPRLSSKFAGLVPGAAGLLGGGFDRARLLALYSSRVGGGDPEGAGEPGGSAAGDAQRAGLEEWFAQLTADLHLNLGTFGDWTFKRGDLPTPSPLERPDAASNASAGGGGGGAGEVGMSAKAAAAEAAAKLAAASAQEEHGEHHAGGGGGGDGGEGALTSSAKAAAAEAAAKLGAAAAQKQHDTEHAGGGGAGGGGGGKAADQALPLVQDSAAVERRRTAEAGGAQTLSLDGHATAAAEQADSIRAKTEGAARGSVWEAGDRQIDVAKARDKALDQALDHSGGAAEAARHRAARAAAGAQAAQTLETLGGMRAREVGNAAGRRERAGGAGVGEGLMVGLAAGAAREAAGGAGEDASARCRMAAICEGAAACQPGVPATAILLQQTFTNHS